jgi:rhodanese-related sulfurtransferase
MNLDQLLPWVAIAAMAAFFVYTRFVGKASPTDARKLVADGARLLDVRTPGEFASGHLDGALNIPVDQLSARLAEVGPAERAVVVYCRSGARSARAAGILKAAGYARVADLGSMSRW